MNFDRTSLAETNCHGNLIDWLVIPYNIEWLAKGQIIKVLEQVAIDIIDIAKLKKKPHIIEDLEKWGSARGSVYPLALVFTSFSPCDIIMV